MKISIEANTLQHARRHGGEGKWTRSWRIGTVSDQKYIWISLASMYARVWEIENVESKERCMIEFLEDAVNRGQLKENEVVIDYSDMVNLTFHSD